MKRPMSLKAIKPLKLTKKGVAEPMNLKRLERKVLDQPKGRKTRKIKLYTKNLPRMNV